MYLVWWVEFSVGLDGWWLLVVYLVWWVELSVGVDGWWLLVVYVVCWVELSVGVDGWWLIVGYIFGLVGRVESWSGRMVVNCWLCIWFGG